MPKKKKIATKAQKAQKKRKNNIVPFTKKKNVKRVTLESKLDSIYNTVNLNTTCSGRCECCKVAMPQMNYCEFVQILNEIWKPGASTKEEKLDLICNSIDYFFKNEFDKWGMDSLVKPCLLLKDGRCSQYKSRPLSCRMYGLWPDDIYTRRVDKFADAYKDLLKREEIPLNKQCPFVKRVDNTVEITEEVIEGIFEQLDHLDYAMKKFTPTQIKNKENYRAFHDWMLWTFFGEDWLQTMTSFVLAADREVMEDQVVQFKKVLHEKFAEDTPQMSLPNVVEVEEEEEYNVGTSKEEDKSN